MELPKSIPQIFYDVISRVIPGSVAIVGISMALNKSISETVLAPFLEVLAFKESSLFLVTTFLVCSYLSGHLISPIGDLIYRKFLSNIFRTYANVLYAVVNAPEKSNLSLKIISFLLEAELNKDAKRNKSESYLSLIYVWSDWLRLQNQEAGARLVKLRAEYNMHSQLGIAGLVTIVIHTIAIPKEHWSSILIAASTTVSLLSSWNYLKAHRTFQRSVINNYYAMKGIGNVIHESSINNMHSEQSAHNQALQPTAKSAAAER